MPPAHSATIDSARLPAFRPCTSPAPVVLAFYGRLSRLPLGAWAEIAAKVTTEDAAQPGQPRLAAARADLRRVVDGSPRLAARHRRRVQHVITVADGVVHRSVTAGMKKAALTAALALVVRPMLGEDVFTRLYAPFADLIPIDELSAPREAATPTDQRWYASTFDRGGGMC